MANRNPWPQFSQQTRTTCPRCDGTQISTLPANNPDSEQEWFRCGTCDHMWSQRRDRTPQDGTPPR